MDKIGKLDWHLLLGAVCAAQHRWEDAHEQFAAGLAIAREIGMPYDQGQILYHWRVSDASRGGRDTAQDRLEAARVIFQQLKALPYLERAEQALAEIASG